MARRLAAFLLLGVVASACGSGQASFLQPGTPGPTPKAVPTPTAVPTPVVIATPEITLAPPSAVSPVPDGYQQIVSSESGFAVGIPSTWVFVRADGDVSIKDQIAAIKVQFPAVSSLVDNQTAMLGVAFKLIMLDPVATQAGGVMTGNLIVSAAIPATDLKTMASTSAAQIKALYKVKTVTTKEITLPAGPTIEFDYAITTSGVSMKIVQYIVLAPEHMFVITLTTTSGAWVRYQPIFATIATTLQSF